MNDIPTPRTDAVQTKAEHEDYDVELAMIVSHARQLERELAELKAERDTPSGVHSCHQSCQRPMCVLRRELAEARETIRYMVENGNAAYDEVKAQRDALAEALSEMIRRSYNEIELRRIAREALATLKGAADE
jgi:predicted  nucleic acid-binding Zn-ribbon protein